MTYLTTFPNLSRSNSRLSDSTLPSSFLAWRSFERFFSYTNLDTAILAKLQTAVSSGEENSIISVHRLELLMVPRLDWLDFLLQASLNSIYGVPVSIWASKIANHSYCARTFFINLPSRTYFSYSSSNSCPQTSLIPGASLGQKRCQSLSCSTFFMKRSGTQRARKRSRQRFSSLPWFLRSSTKSKTSACQGSR